jgi:hypothetical protein
MLTSTRARDTHNSYTLRAGARKRELIRGQATCSLPITLRLLRLAPARHPAQPLLEAVEFV